VTLALVTGGGSGIGRAIARRLAADGADVVIVDVDEVSAQREAHAVEGRAAAADVSDPAAWDRLAGTLPSLDIACLNAGVVTGERDIDDLSDDAYRRIMRVNVDGVVFGLRALVPVLERDAGGDVVVTASLAGLTTMERDPVYSATKHFLVGLVRSVAPALAERGIRVNAVCPGIVDTPLVGTEARARLEAAGFPLLEPEEVAEAVALALASGETGQAWVVQPGREPEPYRFGGVPGPRVPGKEGTRPPL
jgi:NAD(P)-dependent dehydrogenase (short-subunit alcohol dehydrogenase family)